MNKDTLKFIIFAGLFAVPFIPFLVASSLFFPFITTKAFAWRIIIEVVFAAWLLLAILYEEYRPKKSLLFHAVAVFLLIIGLANFFGVDTVRSLWSNFERMEGYVAMLHFGAFFLVIGSVFTEVDWKKWWNTTLATSGLMVIYAFFQLAGVLNINQGGVRVDGTFGNASYLAVYMLFHIFIAALFLWRARKESASRWLYGLLIVGQLVVLYNTATRGATLGLLGGLLVVALLNLRNEGDRFIKKTSVVLIAALIVVGGGFFLLKDTNFVQESPVLERFANISTKELRGGGRSFVWPMAIDGFKDRPIFGWGQENFIYIFQKYYDPQMHRLEPWFDRAHNIFLDWMVAGGILGLLSYLSLYIIALYIIWRRDTKLAHAEKSILTGLFAAYFFHNFFVFDHLMSYVLFFAILSYIHCRNNGSPVWNKSPDKARVNIALPIILILMLASIYFVNWNPISANRSLINALISSQSGEQARAMDAFEKAYNSSTLGRSETIEQIMNYTPSILSSDLPIEERNQYFLFAKTAVIEQSEESPDNARQHMVAGIFLGTTGVFDESIEHLERAKELMPNKQQIYFQLAEVYLVAGKAEQAIDTLYFVAEFSPDHRAQVEELINQIKAR